MFVYNRWHKYPPYLFALIYNKIHPYRYILAHFKEYFSIIFRCYSIPQKSFQNFNKTNSKIDQAHCSISIRIMRSTLSQRFQHFLYNKPVKVENNLKSFQTVFIIDAKNFQRFPLTRRPSTHMMLVHDLSNANLIQ